MDPSGPDGPLGDDTAAIGEGRTGMEVVGRGFLGRGLARLADVHPDVTVLAAGVSSTRTATAEEYHRDRCRVAEVAARCRRDGRLLVYLSSAAADVYGAPGCPGREDEPVTPRSAYGRHKLGLELLVRDSGVRHLTLRLGYVVGPGQPDHQLLPFLTRAVLAGQVDVFRGAHRDLIALDDVVHILDRLLAAGVAGQVVNVASGRSVPVEDIVDHLERRLGVQARRRLVGGHQRYRVSLAKLRRLLPDLPEFGPLYYRDVIDRHLALSRSA
ncbi:NAD(P)-dependent oxidoreductase [Micromonospora sp. NPDC050495]|uniref:NAD-dependent epimerase/dehydratase family protein n=1 Tax=Micromonospora sp. NPDC050495 TaxID=3154936 RepID=UPI00340F3A37